MDSDIERFYKENLVCPETHEALIFANGCFATESGRTYSFENQIPCFLDSTELTESQMSELESANRFIRGILNNTNPDYSAERPFDQPEFCWKWAEKWLNFDTVKSDTKIVCIGGAFADDLPHVNSCYKFNIDHLAHEYVKLLPEILQANTHHIACISEKMPFRDNYADFVYSRNSLDHVCNPVQTLKEIHRILKPQGKFLLSVYYASNIINEHESTSIDDEFVTKCIEPLFSVEHSFITSGSPGWLTMACQKKAGGDMLLTQQEVSAVGKILSYFHSALYFDKRARAAEAAQNYSYVLKIPPVFRTDLVRMLYSLIRLYGITDHVRFNALKQVFEGLFGTNGNFNKIFEKTIVDYNIQLGNDIISNDLSSCARILNDPGRIEGKQILQYLAKLGDGYLDKPLAANVRRLVAETISKI